MLIRTIIPNAIADSVTEGIEGGEDILRGRAEGGTVVDELEVIVGVPVNVLISWEGIEIIDTGEPGRARTVDAAIVDASAAIAEGTDEAKRQRWRWEMDWNTNGRLVQTRLIY